MCVNKKQRGKNVIGTGMVLESRETEQEAEINAGLWGRDCRQMENKTMKENLKAIGSICVCNQQMDGHYW